MQLLENKSWAPGDLWRSCQNKGQDLCSVLLEKLSASGGFLLIVFRPSDANATALWDDRSPSAVEEDLSHQVRRACRASSTASPKRILIKTTMRIELQPEPAHRGLRNLITLSSTSP